MATRVRNKTPKSRSDVAVQGTNDSSIVSKASMVDLGYFPDPYVKYFICKNCRRSPLINRGYYIRAKAVDRAIQMFLQIYSNQKTQILSLGAGYDSLYFRLKKEGCLQNTLFIEIDFLDLVKKKVKLIEHYEALSDLVDRKNCQSDGNIVIDSAGYKVVGVDLTNQALLETTLERCGIDRNLPTLLLSEVVLTYVKSEKVSGVIKWANQAFSTSVFVLYEQVYPDDPFGLVMQKHFVKIGSPLKCINDYPSPDSQKSRFLSHGWDSCIVSDMNQFYHSLSREETFRIASIEPFDEFEEWNLKCAHYVIACAFNGAAVNMSLKWQESLSLPNREAALTKNSTEHDLGGMSCHGHGDSPSSLQCGVTSHGVTATLDCHPLHPRTSGPEIPHISHGQLSCSFSAEVNFENLADTYPLCQRFGHTLTPECANTEEIFMLIGGFGDKEGKHSRLTDIVVYDFEDKKTQFLPNDVCESVGARMHHTATCINNTDVLILGGRLSPAKPGLPMVVLKKSEKASACNDNTSNEWVSSVVPTSGHEPATRWRHTSALHMNGCNEELYVFGGKTHTQPALSDCYCLSLSTWTWKKVSGSGEEPCARHSHTADVWQNKLVISGGLDAQSKPLNTIHLLDVSTAVWRALKPQPEISPRYSHTSVIKGDKLILLGGVNHCSALPGLEIVNLKTETSFTVDLPYVQDPEYPVMLHGHASTLTKQGKVLITGGGGNCFSFGTYLNKSPILLHVDRIMNSLS